MGNNIWSNLLASSLEITKLWQTILKQITSLVNYEFPNINFYFTYLTTLFKMHGVIINFELSTRRNEVFRDTHEDKLSTCPPITSIKLSQYVFLSSSVLTPYSVFIDSNNINRLNNNCCHP
jgi:hypothetical protein